MIPNVLKDVKPEIVKLLGVKHAKWENKKLLVITGQNATGKSFLRRIFTHFLNKNHDLEVIHLSQQGRATSGIVRVCIYGSEDDEATGVLSAKCITGLFRTSRQRTNKHVAIVDEPEIGMGEESALGAVKYICEQLNDWPENLEGMIVITHNRHFVEQLTSREDSYFVCMNEPQMTPQKWLTRKIVPISPQELLERGLLMFRALSEYLKN